VFAIIIYNQPPQIFLRTPNQCDGDGGGGISCSLSNDLSNDNRRVNASSISHRKFKEVQVKVLMMDQGWMMMSDEPNPRLRFGH
jgi:hypothetical protein